MKKRILTFLMASVLMLSTMAEGICAAPADVTDTVTESSLETEDGLEGTEFSPQRAGGLIQPEYHEVENGPISEIYKETETNSKGSATYSHAWDSYSSNYYYNQLSEEQQAFWDKLDAMCLGYLTGTDTVYAQKDGDGDTVYPTKSVLYSNMTSSAALSVALMFKYSNPQYYFLDLGVYGGTYGTGGVITFTLFPAFANGSSRQNATAQMQGVINNYLAQINAQPNDLMKEKKAHDLICEKVVYDPGYTNPGVAMNEYNQVAYSVFCTNSTVCAGYSQAMQLLMNGAGIDCAVVTSADHEWNIIKLNNAWYYVDLTWNDMSEEDAAILGQGIGYKYFNRSYQMFMSDEPRAVQSHTAEALWNGYLPALTYDSGATWLSIGTISTPTATLAAPQIVASGNVVTLNAPTGGKIYYTTDGSNPSSAFTRAKLYRGPFAVSGITKVKAVAVLDGYYDSGISEVDVIPQYTVTLNANGGYIGSKSISSNSRVVIHGNAVGKLPSPKKKNYAFLGWYTKKSGGSKISAKTVVTGNTTYYAHWAKIKAKKASISYVKNSAKKTMKVKIKNISSASGYQIRYSLQSNMSGAKKKTVSENTCTISKLKKGKTYYVQVRMYQKNSVTGKKTYGPWSKSKTVKIKK